MVFISDYFEDQRKGCFLIHCLLSDHIFDFLEFYLSDIQKIEEKKLTLL